LCVARIDGEPVAIGAIKTKTASDFSEGKSGLGEHLAAAFDWELGYLYTERKFEGQGIATNIVRCLLRAYGRGNLMASTEISVNPTMVKILEKQGFRMFGKPWQSRRHDGYLGLFLRLE